MAKPKRGKGLKSTKEWRGTCPVCAKKRVKLLWEKSVDEQKLKVCKRCS